MTYELNGTSDYLQELSSDFASLPLTVFMRNSASAILVGNQTLFAFANGVDGHKCMIRSSGNSIAQARHENAALVGQNAGTGQTLNSWGTLVGRFTSNSSMDIFDSAGKVTNTTAVTGTLTAFDRILVGCGTDASGTRNAFTPLRLNILAIWNVALSDDECLSLTAKMVAPVSVRPSSLIRLYEMQTLNDKMGSRALTPSGSPFLMTTGDPGRSRYARKTKQSQQ